MKRTYYRDVVHRCCGRCTRSRSAPSPRRYRHRWPTSQPSPRSIIGAASMSASTAAGAGDKPVGPWGRLPIPRVVRVERVTPRPVGGTVGAQFPGGRLRIRCGRRLGLFRHQHRYYWCRLQQLRYLPNWEQLAGHGARAGWLRGRSRPILWYGGRCLCQYANDL